MQQLPRRSLQPQSLLIRAVQLRQPQAYLVDTISQRDQTLAEFQAEIDGVRTENGRLARERDEAEGARRAAEADLRRLLVQRQQLQMERCISPVLSCQLQKLCRANL